jgi:NAD(P)-dependent dehydrogenase (short-subunit alcohol dehydrogenase family)
MSTTIEGKAILVTGANRGIGQALVTEALRRGAARVYAGTRQPYTHPDPRVTALTMDITDEGQVRAAAAQVGSLDILVTTRASSCSMTSATAGRSNGTWRSTSSVPTASSRLSCRR